MTNHITGPTRRGALGTAAAAAALLPLRRAQAQVRDPVKIGVLTDFSGIMMDYSGAGTLASVTMAVEDFGGKVAGRPIEILKADHLNKPDIGSAIARQWYDSGVTAIFDIGSTAVAIPVQTMAKEKNQSSSSPGRPVRI